MGRVQLNASAIYFGMGLAGALALPEVGAGLGLVVLLLLLRRPARRPQQQLVACTAAD